MRIPEVVRAHVNLIRQYRLDYRGQIRATAAARKITGLKPSTRGRHLPHLLTTDNLRSFYRTIDAAGRLDHQIMLRLLLHTAVRVSELVNMRVEDVDLDACRIYIERGKGDKDRYVLFGEQLKLALQAYLQAHHENAYLFESRLKTRMTPRWVQKLVKRYAAEAEIPTKVHPHLLRHQTLTWLTKEYVGDSGIQLISGHVSKASLERYQHLSLEDVQDKYQNAMRKLGI